MKTPADLTFSIAGTSYSLSLSGCSTDRCTGLFEILDGFSVLTDTPDFRVAIVPDLAADVHSTLPPNNLQRVWKETAPGEYLFRLQGLSGQISMNLRSMTLATRILNTVYEPDAEFVLARLRLLVLLRLLQQRGIALHSSAVAHDHGALVFFGPSEAGKTTIAQILSGTWSIMSDEVNVLLLTDNGFRVYSTPFSRTNGPVRFRGSDNALRGLFRLEQAKVNEVAQLSNREKYLGMVGNSFFLPDRYHAETHMEHCQAITEGSNVHLLRFSNAPQDAPDLVNRLSPFLEQTP